MGSTDPGPGAQAASERVRVMEQVVHAGDACVLEGHPATMRSRDLGGRVQHRVDRVAIIEGNERPSELVVRRVE